MTAHILIVDDNKIVADVLADAILDQGYQATTVCDGAEMRDCLKSELIDGVLLDVRLPGEDTHSLALHVKKLGLPVIMMTGEHRDIEFVSRLDVPLLHKPFRIHELVALLATMLRT